jgi:hypothetical protein
MRPAKPSDRFKWNKSSLIETDLYIKLYIAALNQFLSAEDKQSLFMISKLFTDGAAEVGRNRITLADFYFKRGEAYYDSASNNPLLRQVITNVYDRSKSFYHHRTGNADKAIALIHNTLRNNRELEEKGFKFLIFDRIQQYHNLSRVYFSLGESQKAFQILSGITCFLIAGKTDLLPDLNENFLQEYDDDLRKTRYFMLCQILFETTGHLQKVNNKEDFFNESGLYFTTVIQAAADYVIMIPEDKLMKKWLLTLADFYDKKYKKFYTRAKAFIDKEAPFYNGIPHQQLNTFFKFIPLIGR